MPNRLSDLLRQVEKESRVLDRAEARALRDEIAGHLDAAVAARMELGATPEEAEAEAIAAFGNVRKIVRGMRPPHPNTGFDHRFFRRVCAGWVFTAITGYVGWHFLPPLLPATSYVLTALGFALLFLVVRESVRARRVQLLPILAMYPLFVLLGAIGQAANAIPSEPRLLAIDRETASIWAGEMRNEARRYEEALSTYGKMRHEYQAGNLMGPARYQVGEANVQYAPIESSAALARAWKVFDERWLPYSQGRVVSARAESEFIDRRLARPWIWDTFGWLGVSAGIVAFPTALTFAVNLFVCFLAWLHRTQRRRRRAA